MAVFARAGAMCEKRGGILNNPAKLILSGAYPDHRFEASFYRLPARSDASRRKFATECCCSGRCNPLQAAPLASSPGALRLFHRPIPSLLLAAIR